MVIQDVVHDYDDDCISDALDGACYGFHDTYDGPGTTREAIAVAVSRYLALIPDHLLAGMVAAARDELAEHHQKLAERRKLQQQRQCDCDTINAQMNAAYYTRTDPGTGREKPLDDRDWPDNG